MALTPKTASKRTPKTKTLNDLSQLGGIVNSQIEPETPAPAPGLVDREVKTGGLAPANQPRFSHTGKFMLVTSMDLRRSVLTGDGVKHCKIVLPADDFRKLTAEGLKHGVTWDEMVRAVITEHCHNGSPFASAVKFLPPADTQD